MIELPPPRLIFRSKLDVSFREGIRISKVNNFKPQHLITHPLLPQLPVFSFSNGSIAALLVMCFLHRPTGSHWMCFQTSGTAGILGILPGQSAESSLVEFNKGVTAAETWCCLLNMETIDRCFQK